MNLSIKSALGAIALTALLSTSAFAQPFGPRGEDGPWFGPGMMMGPGMMGGGGGYAQFCDPRIAGFAAWRIEEIERVLKPTDAQKTAFDAFKAASAKAAELVKASCPTDPPLTAPARIEAMEKRLDAMLQAVKTVRPALDEFYAVLTDEQKARLNAAGPWMRRGWGWHWRAWR